MGIFMSALALVCAACCMLSSCRYIPEHYEMLASQSAPVHEPTLVKQTARCDSYIPCCMLHAKDIGCDIPCRMLISAVTFRVACCMLQVSTVTFRVACCMLQISTVTFRVACCMLQVSAVAFRVACCMLQISAVAFARLLVRLTEGVAAAATHKQHRQRIRTVRAQQHATYDMPHRHWMPMVRPSLSLELVLEEETFSGSRHGLDVRL